jgi:hypothetical protein
MRALLASMLLALTCYGCTISDAERIDAFVKAVTGEVTRERIDHALDSYVDLGVQPLDVVAFGDPRSYAPEQRPGLLQDAHSGLGFLYGKSLNVLRRRIDITGPRARVELQLFGREGMGSVYFVLTKHGDKWLMSEVRISR